MTSEEIFDLIEEIAATSSKTEKERLIKTGADDGEFKAVLKAALDPLVTYGIATKSGNFVSDGPIKQFNDSTWAILKALESRSITGNLANHALAAELGTLAPKSSELLWRIVSKDLRAGFSASTVNKAIPGLITTFDCMLAHKFEESRVKSWPQIVEPKLDGVRVLAFIDQESNSVKFFSRSGKEFFTFEHLKEPLLALPAFDGAKVVIDGEIVSGSFNKTVSEVRKKDVQATDAVFHAFDILFTKVFNADGKSGVGGTYESRRKFLEGLINFAPSDFIKLIPRYIVNSHAEIQTLYGKVRARGLEGLIVKDPKGLYHRRRNHAWMKIKNEEDVDVEVIGYEEGTGKYVDQLGALIIDFNGVKVNVGSGLSDSQRASFWEAKDELIGKLCTVEYHEITPDGSLRHPRFIKWRDDKTLDKNEDRE